MHITPENIKKYASASRSCVFAQTGCTLKPQNSLLSLDFSLIEGVLECVLSFKRINGNGNLLIKNRFRATKHSVFDANDIKVDLNEQKQFSIIRARGCSGALVLSGIEITRTDSEAIGASKEVAILGPPKNNWNTILNACGGSKGIKLSGGVLYASEGAQINDGTKIKSITTTPPNVAKIDKVVKFIYPCTINNIQLKDGVSVLSDTPLYSAISASAVVALESVNVPRTTPPTIAAISTSTPGTLYDSKKKNLSLTAINRVHVNINYGNDRSTIFMKKMGSFYIPMSYMAAGMVYSIAINVQKVNGNGKVQLELCDSSGEVRDKVVFIANSREQYFHLNSGHVQPDGGFMLRIARPAAATVGEVIVHGIRVLDGVPSGARVISGTPMATEYAQASKIVSGPKNAQELVCDIFKHFSLLTPNVDYKAGSYDIKGSINVVGRAARQWFNKIKPLFPNVCESSKSGLAMCSVNDLAAASAVWLEEFDSYVQSDALKILNRTTVIYTPSLANYHTLKNWFPGKNVQIKHRPWPMLGAKQPSPIKYYIYFEKNQLVTDLLIDNWKEEDGLLYVVGVRRPIPRGVVYVSEYEPYDVLYKRLAGAYGLIDMNSNCHYISGIIELAKALGLRFITNNHKYILDTPCMVRNIKVDGQLRIIAGDIVQAITQCNGAPEPKSAGDINIQRMVSDIVEMQ